MTQPIETLEGTNALAFKAAIKPFLLAILNDENFKSASYIDEQLAAAQAIIDEQVDALAGSVGDIASLKERLPAPFQVKPFFHAVYSHALVDSNNYPLALIERDGGKWDINLSDSVQISMSGITSEPISRFSGFLWPWVDSARNLIGGIENDGSLLAR
ncbi:MAG TPA: hypothetical protein PLM58_14880, partial [Novosphingobium sp.]|nr:hypothetical protein [Novosphingobium sp.]